LQESQTAASKDNKNKSVYTFMRIGSERSKNLKLNALTSRLKLEKKRYNKMDSKYPL
jgi:hypothetical protein